MHRRTAGILLIGIAAFLYGVLYLSSAILGSAFQSINPDLFENALESVGSGPKVLGVIALIAGIVYWNEFK